ncbi:hypothetical protein [Lentzea sp. NEAU-D7]|uniref:hypothetical protein n=1 Tax=Lentzea sp. NEAU-D7 TaxID=2994667 RepID=UPI00224B6410|nr:hypothetical protein [Lentzea sp. NEAU-D7]MCX2948441.1 hypothetical protein [Lentzea sp. NEAU-D7]
MITQLTTEPKGESRLFEIDAAAGRLISLNAKGTARTLVRRTSAFNGQPALPDKTRLPRGLGFSR